MTIWRKIVWTFGNLLMLIGAYLLLFVGGLLADEQYNVYAASGDNELVAAAVSESDLDSDGLPVANDASGTEAAGAAAIMRNPDRFNIPVLNQGSSNALTNIVPQKVDHNGPSTISRIIIPKLNLDKKVVEVGWTVQQSNGQAVAVWDVDKYRVGHHKGSSNPGGGGNIVLAGHSGGRAYPFNDIYYLQPGDVIQLYSNDQVYEYAVSDHILVDEVGQPLEKRIENARYIEPTDEEVITMVACWPLTGPNKFKQRVIIRSKPIGGPPPADETNVERSGWTIR